MVKSFQIEGITFTARGVPDEEASIPPRQMRKEPAWRTVEDLSDIPKMFYQLAGKNRSQCILSHDTR